MSAPASFEEDRDAWVRVKLLAGLPLDEAEKAYFESLPPGDALHQLQACPRKSPTP